MDKFISKFSDDDLKRMASYDHLAKELLYIRDEAKKLISENARLAAELVAANEDAAFCFGVMERATRDESCDIGIMLEDADLARKQHIGRIRKVTRDEEN